MTDVEKKSFKKFKNMCAQNGSQLELSTARFSKSFPNFGVCFNHYEPYLSDPPGEYISPDNIKAILDQNKVVVLNIQNMDFRRDTLIRLKGGGGHNICCIGYNDAGKFIFQDSNKFRGSCKKTMSIQTLQTGYQSLLDAKDDLGNRLKAMRDATHVAEMFVADTVEMKRKVLARRSRRNKK